MEAASFLLLSLLSLSSPLPRTWSPPTLANRLEAAGSTVLKAMAMTGVAWDSWEMKREGRECEVGASARRVRAPEDARARGRHRRHARPQVLPAGSPSLVFLEERCSWLRVRAQRMRTGSLFVFRIAFRSLLSLTFTTVRARRLSRADRRHASRPTSRREVAREAYRWAASAFISGREGEKERERERDGAHPAHARSKKQTSELNRPSPLRTRPTSLPSFTAQTPLAAAAAARPGCSGPPPGPGRRCR